MGEPWPERLATPMLLSLTDDVPFVARQEAWGRLEGAWGSSRDGARRVVLVAGEAGSGKTRLVTEFARHVQAGGGAVMYGSCPEAPAPYGAFRQAFDGLAQTLPTAARQELAHRSGHRLRLLAPAMATPGETDVGDGHESERFAMWHTVSSALQAVADRQPLLLILDDLHWVDGATADLLDDLTRGAAPTRTCVVTTFRTEASDVTPQARSVIADLRRRPGTSRVRLTGLERDQIRAFVEAAAGHRFHIGLEPVVQFMSAQTDGNVFFVGELWRHLVESKRLVRPDERWRLAGPLEDVRTPPSVRDLVAARLHRLPPDARSALEWASVIGPTFDVDLLARAAGDHPASVLAGLEPAFAAGVIGEERPGTCRFTHSIVQRSAYDSQLPAARHERHLGIATALAARGDDQGTIAMHLLAALPLADRSEAVAAARSAAAAALAAGRYVEAATYGEAALTAGDDGDVRGTILLEVAEAHMRAGDVAAAQARALAAHELAVASGRRQLVVASAIAYDEANWRAALHGGTSLQVLDTALRHTDDEVMTVRLEAARGRALALSGLDHEAREVSRAAMRRAAQLDDLEATRLAYTALLFTAWTPDTIQDLLGVARRFVDLAVAVANREWEVWALDKVLLGLITLGRLDEARSIAEQHRAAAERMGQPLFQVLDLQARGLLATGEGRFEEAEALARQANDLGQFLSGRDASGGYGVQMFSIRREQGRLDEARPFVEALSDRGEDAAAWQPALAALYAALGMTDEAAVVVRRLTETGSIAIAHDSLRPAALAYLAEAAVAVADHHAAALILEELRPHQGLVLQAGTFLAAYGAADRYLAMLAGLLGRRGDAERHFEAALRLETAAGMPAWVARTQLEYGQLLAHDSASRDRASTLLRFAADTAGRLGMGDVATRARSAVAALAPAEHGRPSLSAGLTPRELAVLRLLVEGRSNRQIGEVLSISHHTAANHVRAVLLKAGCRNRTEAASWAVRNGVVQS